MSVRLLVLAGVLVVVAPLHADPAVPMGGVESGPASEASRPHVSDFVLRRSPGGAALRSFAAPGWGQWYTGHRWKSALAVVVEGGLAAWVAVETREVDRLLADSRSAGETEADVSAGTAVYYDAYIERFEFRRDLLVYLGLAVLGFTIDAYVDATLYGFDDEFDEFPEPATGPTVTVAPGAVGDGAGISLSVVFP